MYSTALNTIIAAIIYNLVFIKWIPLDAKFAGLPLEEVLYCRSKFSMFITRRGSAPSIETIGTHMKQCLFYEVVELISSSPVSYFSFARISCATAVLNVVRLLTSVTISTDNLSMNY